MTGIWWLVRGLLGAALLILSAGCESSTQPVVVLPECPPVLFGRTMQGGGIDRLCGVAFGHTGSWPGQTGTPACRSALMLPTWLSGSNSTPRR